MFVTAFILDADSLGDVGEIVLHDLPFDTSEDAKVAKAVLAIPTEGVPPGFFVSNDTAGYEQLLFVDLPTKYDSEMGVAAVGIQLVAQDTGPTNAPEPVLSFSGAEYSIGESSERFVLPVIRDHWISRTDPTDDGFCQGSETSEGDIGS